MIFQIENKLIKQGYSLIVGIDEAGRGSLAGPIVAAAAIFKNNYLALNSKERKFLKCVKDSKLLSEKQRENLFKNLSRYFFWGIGMCSPKTIDKINISQANFQAMKKALDDLQKRNKRYLSSSFNPLVLVDGNRKIPDLIWKQKSIIRGDKLVKSISAASIFAKVKRDQFMKKLHVKYPEYGFEKNKGYGTKIHIKVIKKIGLSPIHRKSFRLKKPLNKV